LPFNKATLRVRVLTFRTDVAFRNNNPAGPEPVAARTRPTSP
jgi:hypothetical protein